MVPICFPVTVSLKLSLWRWWTLPGPGCPSTWRPAPCPGHPAPPAAQPTGRWETQSATSSRSGSAAAGPRSAQRGFVCSAETRHGWDIEVDTTGDEGGHNNCDSLDDFWRPISMVQEIRWKHVVSMQDGGCDPRVKDLFSIWPFSRGWW